MRWIVVMVALIACGKSDAAPEEVTPGRGEAPLVAAGWAGKDDPENLKGLLTAIRDSAGKDAAKAGALTRGLMVDAGSVKVAIADADLAKRLVEQVAAVPKDDVQLAGALDPKNAEYTEIRAHGATTEEIIANAEGSVARAEFPGGVKQLADKGMLQKGVTFYEVEWTRPGEEAGMKYHLFFWDGERWRMLGPAWRGL